MKHALPASDPPLVATQRADRGTRIVALFEAAKGLLVLLAGCGVLSLLHRDAQAVAEDVVLHFHLNPSSRYPHVFLQLMNDISNKQLWMLAAVAFAYAGVRLIEAYGLWRQRAWAEWFAVASGSIYIPMELYELLSGVSWIKAATLAVNLAIVGYMAYVLRQQRRNKPVLAASTMRIEVQVK